MATTEEAPVTTLADSSYPLLNVFWSMLIFFAFVMWIWLLISVFSDLFGRHDLSGLMKGLWCVALLLVPFVSVLIYLLSQGRSMTERRVKAVEAQQAAYG